MLVWQALKIQFLPSHVPYSNMRFESLGPVTTSNISSHWQVGSKTLMVWESRHLRAGISLPRASSQNPEARANFENTTRQVIGKDAWYTSPWIGFLLLKTKPVNASLILTVGIMMNPYSAGDWGRRIWVVIGVIVRGEEIGRRRSRKRKGGRRRKMLFQIPEPTLLKIESLNQDFNKLWNCHTERNPM